MERYQPYAYHKRQPVYMPRPFDPVDTARYEAEERAWCEESFSWYRPFPSIQAWYANGCLPQRGPAGWIMTSPKWQPQGNPTSPIYANSSEEERGPTMYSPTACRMSPLSLGPSRKPDAPPPQGSVLLETIAKGRSMVFECGVGAQEAKGMAVDEGKEGEGEEEDYETFVAKCAAAAIVADSGLVGISMWGKRYPFGSPNAPEPPWAKDPSWPLGKAARAAVAAAAAAAVDEGKEEEEEEEEDDEDEEVVFSHAPDPHANSEDEDEVPLSHFVVDGTLKGPAPVVPPPNVEPGVYMDDDEAENGKFAWKWTPAEPAAKEEVEEAKRVEEKEEEEKGGGGGGGDSDFYDD